jgi:hypothetical protein
MLQQLFHYFAGDLEKGIRLTPTSYSYLGTKVWPTHGNIEKSETVLVVLSLLVVSFHWLK